MTESASAKEASPVEFTLSCPNDGPVDVSIEDVDTVVLSEPGRAQVVFVCPECGESIAVDVVIPSFLVAAIEAMAEDIENGATGGVPGIVALVSEVPDADVDPQPEVTADQPSADAYCEYFRRQLEHVTCVEEALAEIDSKR